MSITPSLYRLAKTAAVATVILSVASIAALTAKAADIADTVASSGQFKTLSAALQASGLADELKGKGPFTLFAPTDKAFANLSPDTLQMLMKPENKDKLIAVLNYHVVPQQIVADDLRGKRSMVPTAQGHFLELDGIQWWTGVDVNGTKIVDSEIPASNGAIQPVDTVLMPK